MEQSQPAVRGQGLLEWYEALISAALVLVTSSGDITMPVKPRENAGVLYAVLRSKNPEIKPGTAETVEKENAQN